MMESPIARSLLLLSFILGVVGQATITTRPKNVAQYLGDNVTLVCELEQSALNLVWSECVTTAPVCNGLYQDGVAFGGITIPPRYSVVVGTGSSGKKNDFVITGVNQTDGGQFQCNTPAKPDPAYAEVIVLGSDMKCSNNLTSGSEVELGGFIHLSSDVTFHGRWTPVATFRYLNNTVLPGRVNETSGNTAKYDVLLEAGKGLHGQTLSTEWYFDDVNGTATGEATNTPTFPAPNTCSSEQITVFYPPEGLTIAPIQASYHVDETITCTAQGYPAPDIQWINMNDSSVSVNCAPVTADAPENKCELVVSENLLDTTAAYQCRPCNNYFSQERCISKNITFTTYITTTTSTTTLPTTATTPSTTPEVTGTTEPPPKDEPLSSAVIGAIAACCAVVVAIIIVLIVICCMKKRKKEAAAARSQANTNKPIHGDAVRTTHMVNDQPPAPAPFPDEKVGYDPYSAPYSHHNYPDTEAPSHDPQNRNEEGLHYADLALEDVPRSRKPIQVLEPSGTEYAEIRRA